MLSWISNNWWWIFGLLTILAIAMLLIFHAWKIQKIRKSHKSIIFNNKGIEADIDCISIHKIYCCQEIIGICKKPEWYEVLEDELKRIPVGNVLFNPPGSMKVGVVERVVVRISKDANANILEALKGRGVAQIESIKVSELMKVKVSGSDFKITQLNEEEQFISSHGFTEWAWNIKPQKSGNKILHVHITLRIRLPFGEEKKDYPVIDRDVIVKVNPAYSAKVFIDTYWKWVATAVILPLVGLIWKGWIK